MHFSWWMLPLAAAVAIALALGIRRWLRARRRRARGLPRPRYPIVLAHGFLGFDEIAIGERRHLYFRGIAAHLESLGADVHSPRVPMTAGVEARAQRLADLVRAIPAERVNIVAHSMGGIDARYAISRLGLADKVASLTTIGTPHLGTPLADAGDKLLARLTRMLRRFWDLRAFSDLTTARMARFNREISDVPGVAYGSIVARSGRLRTTPLLWATHVYLASRAGPNDGVVPVTSQPWGDVVSEIEADHWAQIGWSRGFDAAGMYEELMRELRARGF